MIAWAEQIPALLVGLFVIFLPGLAIGAALRLRGLALAALAPAATTVTLSVLAIVLDALGLPWGPGAILLGIAIVVALVWGATLGLGPRRAVAAQGRRALVLVGLAVGAVAATVRVVTYIDAPTSISQSNDAVFHLNALRWVMESGSASSFDLTGVVGAQGFYPGAWHALVSTVALFSGVDIPIAVNMVTLVTVAAVWPLGVAWFTQQVTGSRTIAGVAAALSSTLLSFPMLMVQWGVLYPNLLSVALLPSAAAVIVAAPVWVAGRGPVAGGARGTAVAAAALLGTVGAIAIAQPATLLAWLVLAVTFAAGWLLPRAMRSRGSRGLIYWAGFASILVSSSVIWFILTRSTTGSHWPPFRGKLEAVADVLLNGQVMLPFAVVVSVFAMVGLVFAVGQPDLRWLAASWIIFSGLYVVAAAIGQPWLRQWLVGAWYADPYRLASLAPVVVLPLAAIGLEKMTRFGIERIRRMSGADFVAVMLATMIAIVSVFQTSAVMMPKVFENEWDEESRYDITDDTWLSTDERALLERMPQNVPEDARVIGNPSTGTGFGYMMSGLDVYPRTWSHPRDAAWVTIQNGLREAGNDPAVCEALAVFGSPKFALDFGDGEATPGRFVLPAMSDFEGQPGFELVDREGDASLWRLTACD